MNLRFRAWHFPEKKMYFAGYQKLLAVVLCKDDCGTNQGRGLPVKDARYDDCDLMQATGIPDKNGREIFEGDVVRIFTPLGIFEGEVETVPDMYKSRGLHPLQELLDKLGIKNENQLEFEISGNRYEIETKGPLDSSLPPCGRGGGER